MTPKRVTLAIAILSTLATVLAAISDALPPQWALLVAALGAGAYGVVRALQKVKDGVPLKGLLASTETWGAALVVLAAIVSAVAGVVPASWAGAAATIAALLIKLARVFQANSTDGAAPLPKTEDTPVTTPRKPKS